MFIHVEAESCLVICFANLTSKSSLECKCCISVLASQHRCANSVLCSILDLGGVDTGFVSVKGANVFGRSSSALAQQTLKLVTRVRPTLIREALASATQQQGQLCGRSCVCSTKAERGRHGLVRFCLPLLFPISYASCFASFEPSMHLTLEARVHRHSAAPSVVTQFTKDDER